MEGITSSRLPSYTVLSFLLLFTLLSSSSSACNSTIDSCSSNNATPCYYSQNTTNPSNKTTSSDQNTMKTYESFILTSCNSSTYPSICYHYLSPYALKIEGDPLKFCNSSLSLILKEANKASSLISKFLTTKNITATAVSVLNDCLDNVRSSVDEVKKSLDDMNHLDDTDKEFQMSTIKTYVSAAITDDQTCYDEFDEEDVDAGIRDKIRKSLVNVQRMTSNALYFISNLKY